MVVNKTSRIKNAETRYHVQMASLEDSKEIRLKFGSFFIGGGGEKRPDLLKKISINNLVTPATSVRVAIMKVLGQRYLDSNPGARVQVIKYESRPMLKLSPPASASDRRVKSFNYIDAIQRLKSNFTRSELDVIAKSVGEGLLGNLRAIFSVISDDDIKKRQFKSSDPKSSESASRQTSGSASVSTSTSGSGVTVTPVESLPSDESMTSASGTSPTVPTRSRGDKRGPSASPPRAGKYSKKSSKSSHAKK